MEIDKLIKDLESVDLESEEVPFFILDNDIKRDNLKLYFITDVCLNFYELWAIFRVIPNINNDDKIRYSWTFTDKDAKYIFVLCDWNNENKLLQTRNWRILSNTLNDKIVSKFLKTLCGALECYNKYYKHCIETRDFSSDNKEVNRCLQDIKISLIKNREILKSL
jgi:hypothetical protein